MPLTRRQSEILGYLQRHIQDQGYAPSFEEIAEEVAILAGIQKGEEDADAGRTIPHDEVKKRLQTWLSK